MTSSSRELLVEPVDLTSKVTTASDLVESGVVESGVVVRGKAQSWVVSFMAAHCRTTTVCLPCVAYVAWSGMEPT